MASASAIGGQQTIVCTCIEPGHQGRAISVFVDASLTSLLLLYMIISIGISIYWIKVSQIIVNEPLKTKSPRAMCIARIIWAAEFGWTTVILFSKWCKTLFGTLWSEIWYIWIVQMNIFQSDHAAIPAKTITLVYERFMMSCTWTMIECLIKCLWDNSTQRLCLLIIKMINFRVMWPMYPLKWQCRTW